MVEQLGCYLQNDGVWGVCFQHWNCIQGTIQGWNVRRGEVEYNITFSIAMICVIRFHGKGKLIFPNGGTFTADWVNGEAVTPETGNGVSADPSADLNANF